MRPRTQPWSLSGASGKLVALVILTVLVGGCAANRAFSRGNSAARANEWDVAVDQYRRALQSDPKNVEYRIALERAMRSASAYYADQARIAEARGQLDNALRAYRRAAEFDPTNRPISAKITDLERRLRDQAEASAPRPNIEQLRENARQTGPEPLVRINEVLPALNYTNASVRDILTSIGMFVGINVTFERDYQEPRQGGYTVSMDNVTVEQALNQIVAANGLFYKVMNPRTIMIINDNQQKRLAYEEQVLKVLRVSHADANELATMIQQVVRIPGGSPQAFQVFANKTQNTITVRATSNVISIIERLVDISDTPRAEVVVDVEILEVNRTRAKQYGLDLGNYSIGAVYSPEVDPRGAGADGAATLNPQAVNLDTLFGPLGRSDFYLALPAAAIRFLERDTDTKVLAKPQLRGSEGDKLVLNLGDEIPVPTTVFTPLAQGGTNFNPLSSFDYRPVGIIVEITPRVTYEDEILLELKVENSTLGQGINISGSNLPTFSTRRVETKLRLRDGESNLLAGLIRESDRRLLSGFPGILRLPIIKQLFSANDTTIEQTDIVMLLTPRIIRTKEITQEDIDALFIGTATNLGLGGPPPLIAQPPADAAPAPAPQPGAPPAPAGAPAPGAPPAPNPGPGAANSTQPAVPGAAGAATRDTAQSLAGAATTSTTGTTGGQVILTPPPTTDFRVGSNGLTVPINVTGASRLSNVSLTVTYNPAALRVRAVQQGGFMSSGGGAVAFTEDHATPGRVDIVIMRTGDTTGAAGAGLLAGVSFDAIGPGPANLQITGTASAPGGATIPVQFAPVAAVTVK